MDSITKKIIDDLVKGAAESEGFIRGSRMSVEVKADNGREEKLANHAALGAGLGGLLLPGIGAPIGAALGADKGQGLAAAGGSLLGGIGGAAGGGLAGGGIGALLGALAGNPGAGAALGAPVGAGLGGLHRVDRRDHDLRRHDRHARRGQLLLRQVRSGRALRDRMG